MQREGNSKDERIKEGGARRCIVEGGGREGHKGKRGGRGMKEGLWRSVKGRVRKYINE